jgi:hypothetical protein
MLCTLENAPQEYDGGESAAWVYLSNKGGSAEQIDTVIVRNGGEEVGHCRAMVLQPGASHIGGNSWDEE